LSLASADLNGDALPDFVLGNYYNGRISVLLNNNDGTFRAARPVWTIGDVPSVSLPDFNGDTVPDLVAASFSGRSAVVAVGRGDGEFESPTYLGGYPANTVPTRPADLDRDGLLDLAVFSPGGKSISLLGSGSEFLALMRRDDYPVDGTFADFDSDGITDMVLATVQTWRGMPDEPRQAAIRFSRGRPDGTFEAPSVIDADAFPELSGFSYETLGGLLSVLPGDFSGDGLPDVALILPGRTNELRTYVGSGDGAFRRDATISDFDSVAVPLVDFDVDGRHDIALMRHDAASRNLVSVVFSSADGRLRESAPQEVCAMSGTPDLRTGDFNGDGKPDLAAVCGGRIEIWLNTLSGQFEAGPRISWNETSYLPLTAVADFDRDGKDDLILPVVNHNSRAPSLVLLLSGGDGAFRISLTIAAEVDPVSITAGHFDDDGKPDLAMVDGTAGTVTILRNDLRVPATAKRHETNQSRAWTFALTRGLMDSDPGNAR
jgi:hypothetical protein